MPLTFNVSKIENYNQNFPGIKLTENGQEREIWNPITEALVMNLMVIGIGAITEQNFEEYWTRLSLYQTHLHPLLRDFDGEEFQPRPITREEARQHIGLTTNVSTMTRAQFDKHFMVMLRNQQQDQERGFPKFLQEEKGVQ